VIGDVGEVIEDLLAGLGDRGRHREWIHAR
jgi:hypothetical protein